MIKLLLEKKTDIRYKKRNKIKGGFYSKKSLKDIWKTNLKKLRNQVLMMKQLKVGLEK